MPLEDPQVSRVVSASGGSNTFAVSGPRAVTARRCRSGSSSSSSRSACKVRRGIAIEPNIRKKRVHEIVAHGLELSKVRDVVLVDYVTWQNRLVPKEEDIWLSVSYCMFRLWETNYK